MDADASPTRPSPSRSKKRPSRLGNGHTSPNPSPRRSTGRRSELKRRLRRSAESAALALAAVAARASAASVRAGALDEAVGRRGPSGVRVEGGDSAIHMLGAAAARVDGSRAAVKMPRSAGARDRGRVAAQRLGPAGVRVGVSAGHGAVQKHWSDADEFTLLAAAAAFRKRTGRAPVLPDMVELFDSIRDSVSTHIDKSMVYYKLKRLKSKLQHSGGPRDRLLRDLCVKVWGVPASKDDSDGPEADERRAVPDAAANPAMMPVVAEVLDGYWKTNERVMAGVPLEKGLSLLGGKKGRLIETKWRQQLDEEMQTQMRRHDLAKEVCALLSDAIKDLGRCP